ncbi:24503_t:CDS:2, partial [Dentiscutata erythropus]
CPPKNLKKLKLPSQMNKEKHKEKNPQISQADLVDWEPEQPEDDEENGSVEMPHITYKEALDAISRIELYLMQQDLHDLARTEHDIALSKLYESVRKFWNASFKQLNIEAFLEPAYN